MDENEGRNVRPEGKMTAPTVEEFAEVLKHTAVCAEFPEAGNLSTEHVSSVGWMAENMGLWMGMKPDEAKNLGLAAILHDVGKVGIPHNVLKKHGEWTEDERKIANAHTLIGWKMLKNSDVAVLKLASGICKSHHEKFNGTGYPEGLARERIPKEGRIVALADAIDAICKKEDLQGKKPEDTLEILKLLLEKASEIHFDPEMVRTVLPKIKELHEGRAKKIAEIQAKVKAAKD